MFGKAPPKPILLAVVALLLLAPSLLSQTATSANGSGPAPAHQAFGVAATPEHLTHLPRLQRDPTPAPLPTPTERPSPPELWLRITPGNNINASTFAPGSFTLENRSQEDIEVDSVQIDLSTGLLPDMVFDPAGAAGDTVAKNLTVDADTGVGFVKEEGAGWQFDGPHDNGFDVLELFFGSFDPGDLFAFSVDVDPTSIQGTGAPGPNESGSVSGLELTGALVTVSFSNGAELTGQVYRSPGSTSGAEVVVREGLPPAPSLALVGMNQNPAQVAQASQTVRATGPVQSPVHVLVIEAGLFTAGLPGGGFDLDPFEANSAVAVREHLAQIGPGGFVDVPIELSRSHEAAGLNHIVAAAGDYHGRTGALSSVYILELLP